MSNKLYITGIEDKSGKSVIAMGLMEVLLFNVQKVAFFRPFIDVKPDSDEKDNDLVLILETFELDMAYEDMYALTVAEANILAAQGKHGEVLERIMNKFTKLEENYDFVLCEGTDFSRSTVAFELDINSQVANNLGCPVLLVSRASDKDIEGVITSVEISIDTLIENGNDVIATFINRVKPEDKDIIIKRLKNRDYFKNQLVYALPEIQTINNPTVGDIVKALDARVLYGKNWLDLPIHRYSVAAMQLDNFLDRVRHGALVVTPGDRADIIIACLSMVASSTMPYISGIVLTGGILPTKPMQNLIDGFKRIIPILSVPEDTFPTAQKLNDLRTVIMPKDTRKIDLALENFMDNVNVSHIENKILKTQTSIVTPVMFGYQLLKKAQSDKQHIVLPEGHEPRILKAAEILLRRGIVDITLLGDKGRIHRNITHQGLKITDINIIDPSKSELLEEYVQTYYELRKHKGTTLNNARDIMVDVNFFGTMMVYKGHADGLVSGATHTTANTIRPSLQFIKTKPGCKIVSSVMLMCLKDKVLIYGDCAINPNPNSEQLSSIALTSAQTAKNFNIEPRVAMLSYSSGQSGTGADVEIVKEATKIAQEKIKLSNSDLKLEGPIQYDAAVDMDVAKTKMPDSEVAGRATVLIFPDLNTGNNTYKAVQRSAGAIAIGPVLQGLRKPVNDLSRGCLVADIVNTIAITAIQAQAEKNSVNIDKIVGCNCA